MVRQCATQRFRRALIEQYAHLGRGECAARSMIKHRTDLFMADAREPLYKLRRQRSVFKILEER